MQSRKRLVLVILSAVAVMVVGSCIAAVATVPPLLRRASGSYVQILGRSMEPNFQADQLTRVEVVSLSDLERGDVVVCEIGGKSWVKRLVGLPGETVEIRDGQVLVNGQVLDEPYDIVPLSGNCGPFTLGEDEYFILGDNRPMSNDSCNFGPVPGSSLVQRVVP